MAWYCAAADHLLNEDNNAHVDKPPESILHILKEKVCALYKAILLFQMKSVCYYYRNQIVNLFRQLGKIDDWNGARQAVVDAENAFSEDWNRYKKVQASDLWGKLVDSAKTTEAQLRDIGQTLREFIAQQYDLIALRKKMRLEDKDNKCLQALRLVDPRDDMTKIEKDKGGLYHDVCKWILEHEKYTAFTNWDESNHPPRRLLWIKGPAGTGKTMLMIGIIRQLLHQPAALVPTVSFFFCQSKKTNRDNATATMRSLIWMMLFQQPHLIKHLRTEYERSGEGLFTDDTALEAASRVFAEMLKDARPVYFLIDALDECDDTQDIIALISTSLTLSNKVRWLVSGRPDDVLTKIRVNPDFAETLDELDILSQKDRVEKYIEHRLSDLKDPKLQYTADHLDDVTKTVRERADNNLLWVSLVFNDLKRMRGSYAKHNIKHYPRGLSKLYDHKMDRIEKMEMEEQQYCCDVLMAASLAYRLPLSLSELSALVPWSAETDPYTYVQECHSFLTIETDAVHNVETVSVIHKSAKDYLENHQDRLRRGTVQGHADIVKHSIDAMLSSTNDIFDLERWGHKSKDITPLESDRVAPIQYSCVFWLDHLRDAIKQNPRMSKDLCNAGFDFLKVHFLHWLESLSVLHELSAGITSVRKLLNDVEVCLYRLITSTLLSYDSPQQARSLLAS
jgi:hypothetical protein